MLYAPVLYAAIQVQHAKNALYPILSKDSQPTNMSAYLYNDNAHSHYERVGGIEYIMRQSSL